MVGALVTSAVLVIAPGTAMAGQVRADDPADGQATVSGKPSAPDVSRLELDYDPTGSITLTVRFHAALDTIDTAQNYAFYSNFTVGHTYRNNKRYSCGTSTAGDVSGQHHVLGSSITFFDQATVQGFDGLLQFTRTVAADKRSITITGSSPVLAGRSYDCATYVLRGRRRGPAENLNTRYDEHCNCWYFATDYDLVGERSPVDFGAPLYFEGYAPPSIPACDDGVDNDGDGAVDILDPGCADANGPSEANPACSDGLDNDGDGDVDITDDDCSFDSRRTSEGAPPPACANGRDDDGDGKSDRSDPGCRGKASGTDETDPAAVRSTFRLRAKAVRSRCRIDTGVEVLPDLAPEKLFPFAKVQLTVRGPHYRVTRKLPLADVDGYRFKLRRAGRYTVTGHYPGDPFRLKSKTLTRRVTVPARAC